MFGSAFDTGRFTDDSIHVYGTKSQAIWLLQCRTAFTSHRKQQYLPKMIESIAISLFFSPGPGHNIDVPHNPLSIF